MNKPKEKSIPNYEKNLEIGISVLSDKIRASIAETFHMHTSFLQHLNKQEQKEKDLFHDWKKKIDLFMKHYKQQGKELVFLFDIDETLAVYGSNDMRPSGVTIIQYIKNTYPGVVCGICSSRNLDSVKRFADLNSGFDNTYIFSAREVRSDVDDVISQKYGLHTQGARSKYNARMRYAQQFPGIQFVLIDDLLDSYALFEAGIAIPFDKRFFAVDFDIYDYI